MVVTLKQPMKRKNLTWKDGRCELAECAVTKTRRKIPINTDDPDFWYFCGVWLAEGSFAHTSDKTYTYREVRYDRGFRREYVHKIRGLGDIVLSLNKDDRTKDRILKIISEKFRRTPQLYSRSNLLTVKFGHKTLAEFLQKTFGRGVSSKHIPFYLLGLRQGLLASLIEGLFMGDGTPRKEGGWSLSTSNSQFVAFLVLALAK